MIGLCTDSNSQLPAALALRFGVEVVPVTVIVDDVDYLEGIDLDADDFYAKFDPGRTPIVTTSQPSPGQFAVAYETLVARGATEILSVHVGAGVSGTLNSARLAARSVAVPVRLVDSATASFGISCCVWAAAEAIEAGASIDEAAAAAETLAPDIGNVFIVGGLDLLRASARSGDALSAVNVADGIPVLSLADGQVKVVDRVGSVDEAVAAMAACVLTGENGCRVAVGFADRQAAPLADALEAAIVDAPNVIEVVRYRVGPSVGAHTGPGTVGAFWFSGRTYRSAESGDDLF